MLRRDRFAFSSLRTRLGAVALAGLVTTALLTFLLVRVATLASAIVDDARNLHGQVEVYAELLTAMREYQASGYRKTRAPDDASVARQMARSKGRLEGLLVRVEHLPGQSPAARRAAADIVRQGRVVVAHFAEAQVNVMQVDAKWRQGGIRAALAEVVRVTEPAITLDRMVRAEIGRGDHLVNDATRRAKALIGLAVTASLVGMLLVIGLSLTLIMLLQLRLRPGLQRLEAAVRAYRSGDFTHRTSLAGRDELARLSAGVDSMAQTIEEKHAALLEVQQSLERTVAERTSALQHANAELASADQRRRNFLADVSHELRTPLTIIRGELQVALRTADRTSLDPHDTLARILEQTDDLSRMVDDLFLLARAQASGLPIHREPADLGAIIRRVVSDFETLTRETGGSIRFEPGKPMMVDVDQERLRRALAALIDNALRHCQPGVNIRVALDSRGDQAIICVSDDGPGIAQHIALRPLRRFVSGHARGGGSGLGLSLVNAIVEAHGGRTELDAPPDGGTLIKLLLPLYVSESVAA